jgi:uncharacterized membrane protein
VSEREDRLELLLGWVLRVGVLSSTVCLAAGLTAWLVPGGHSLAEALLRAGLVLLMATPIVRVAASNIVYVVTRDWVFAVLTSVVLAELAAAVVAAIRG